MWMGFVSVYMLLQGMAIETHGTMYESYLSAQALVLIGLLSATVYGAISLLVAYAIGNLLRKGTRLLERGSTMAAKLALAALPHYTFANSLQEMGGEIDILDEEYLAGVQEFLLTAPFTMLLTYHIAMLVAPNVYVQWFTMLVSAVSGYLAWKFAHQDEVSRKKAGNVLRITNEIMFKLGVPVAILSLAAGIFLYGTATGLDVRESMANFWYGVTFHAYGPIYWYAGYIVTGLAVYAGLYIFWGLSKAGSERNADHSAFVAAKAAIAATEAEKTAILTGDTSWAESVWRYLSYAFFLGMISALCFTAGSCWAAGHQLMDGKSFRLGMQNQDSAVGIASGKITSHGKKLACTIPGGSADPCVATQVDENGTKKVLLSFTTAKRARGVVEFTDPQAAIAAGLPPYITVNSQSDACGSGTGGKLCQHTASFEIPTGPYPGYKIVMRNDEQPKPAADPNPDYGKVETLAVSKGVRADGFAVSAIGKALEPLTEQLRKDNPELATPPAPTTTAQPPAPPPAVSPNRGSGGSRVASRCTSGCGLPPLEVLPQFR